MDIVALSPVKINRLARGVGAGADHSRRNHRNRLVRLPKTQQRPQSVRFRGFALQLIELQLERVVFVAQALVLARSVLQSEIVPPRAADAADSGRTSALER